VLPCVGEHTSAVVQHLQRDAQALTKARNGLEGRYFGSGGVCSEGAGKSHQRSRLELGRRECHRLGFVFAHLSEGQCEIERLAFMATREAKMGFPQYRKCAFRGERDFVQLGERHEVQPIAGVQRARHADHAVQRGAAAPLVGTVLDVVDNQGARMQQLDGFHTGGGHAAFAAAEREARFDEAGAERLGGSCQKIAGVAQERSLEMLCVERAAGCRQTERQGGLSRRRRFLLSERTHGVISLGSPRLRKSRSPRGGRPMNMRRRSRGVSSPA